MTTESKAKEEDSDLQLTESVHSSDRLAFSSSSKNDSFRATRPLTSSKVESLADEEEEDLVQDEEISISLCETNTMTLFVQDSVCIHKDSKLFSAVDSSNQRYDAMLKKKCGNEDLWTANEAQTFNAQMMNKETMAVTKVTKETGCTATSWDIHDSTKKGTGNSYLSLNMKSGDAADSTKSTVSKQVEEISKVVFADPKCFISVGCAKTTTKDRNLSGGEVLRERKHKKILNSPSMYRSLRLVERLVQQQMYQKRHLEYRGFSVVERMSDALQNRKYAETSPSLETGSTVSDAKDARSAGDVEAGGEGSSATAASFPSSSTKKADEEKNASDTLSTSSESDMRLDVFWRFECDETSGRAVTCLSWNHLNHDLLVVGYNARSGFDGDDDRESESGIIAFWTLKSPKYPERILSLETGVSALAFSKRRPYLLAVGTVDGRLAIYDVRSDSNEPVLETGTGNASKHKHTIWQVQWVDKGNDKGGEVVVSISTDGKIKEWRLKKGLQCTDMMSLKRPNVDRSDSSRWRPLQMNDGDGLISREACGLCFDFALQNPHLYYVGTSDGHVHSCSCSYNDQSLRTSATHRGPVNRLQCHPSHPGIFLTCGDDWTVQLWNMNRTASQGQRICIFQQSDLSAAVSDVEWSTSSPTVFASVAMDGRVEVWDLGVDIMSPVITHLTKDEAPEAPPRRLTRLAFGKSASVISVGDQNGSVAVYSMRGVLERKGGEGEGESGLVTVLKALASSNA
eukprot:g3108.t1